MSGVEELTIERFLRYNMKIMDFGLNVLFGPHQADVPSWFPSWSLYPVFY